MNPWVWHETRTFSNCHIEQGDYPGGTPTWGISIPRYSSIRLLTVNQIKFIGCIFNAPTLLATETKYSITASQCPYYITTSNCIDLSFIDCSIGTGYDRGKLLSMGGDGFVSNCYFFNDGKVF